MNTNDVSTQFDPNSHFNNNYVINNQNGPFVKVTLLDEQPLYCPRTLAEVFTIENFSKIVNRVYSKMRNRKINRALSLFATIFHAADSHGVDHNRFVDWYFTYLALGQRLDLPWVHKVSYHALINTYEYFQCMLEIFNQAVVASRESLTPSPFMQMVKENLLEPLGLSDIVVGDGAYLSVFARAQNEMPCKASGHMITQMGDPSKSTGLKICLVNSILTGQFLHLSIDEASKGEHVYDPKLFAGLLFLYDRAMDSKEFRFKINEVDGSYIIRCRTYHIYKIVEAFDEEGRPMPELIGKPLQSESIPSDYNGYIDATIEVPCSSGIYRERVIICPAINTQEYIDSLDPEVSFIVTTKEKRHMFLYTNLPRDKVNAFSIKVAYELRWDVEINIKQSRATETLQQINSGKPYIILVNILASAIGSILHKYQTCCAQNVIQNNQNILQEPTDDAKYYIEPNVNTLQSIAQAHYEAAEAAKEGAEKFEDNGIRVTLPTIPAETKIALRGRSQGGQSLFYNFMEPMFFHHKNPELEPECFTALHDFKTRIPSSYDFYLDFTASGRTLARRKDIRIKLSVLVDQFIKSTTKKSSRRVRLRQAA